MLDLNNYRLPYKEFSMNATGHPENLSQMPALINEGRVPLSVSQIMEQRIYSGKIDWTNNHFDTGDAILYGNGEIVAVLDCPLLRQINPKSRLTKGALNLSGIDIAKIGETSRCSFQLDNLKSFIGEDLTKEEAKNNPIWQLFARDNSLLEEYIDVIFTGAYRNFGYDKCMGIHLDMNKYSGAGVLRPVTLYELFYLSRLCSLDNLDSKDGRLVG